MGEVDFLLWVRGPGLTIAVAIFLLGCVLRVFEIYTLGRTPDLSAPRENRPGSGWRTIVTRSVPSGEKVKRSAGVLVPGYLFHIGFFVCLFFFVPHIELIRGVVGIGWPGLPTPVIDLFAVITLIALLVTLATRLLNPVRRYLSTLDDWAGWTLTFLPVLTGWMAYHHLLFSYTTMLALHILTAELLLIALPFTKLAHFITLFVSRWYNGEAFARKGVAS